MLATTLTDLHPTPPHPLPFAPTLHIRAFMLPGDLVVYAAPGAEGAVQYLNHWHEAAFGDPAAPVVIHEADAPHVEVPIARTFNRRETGDFELIPTPGHTPGATAFLWNRILFTGDSVYLSHGEWVAAVLDDSDREAYIASLELLKTVEFDYLVPWAASAGDPWFASAADAPARLDAIIARLRRGEDR